METNKSMHHFALQFCWPSDRAPEISANGMHEIPQGNQKCQHFLFRRLCRSDAVVEISSLDGISPDLGYITLFRKYRQQPNRLPYDGQVFWSDRLNYNVQSIADASRYKPELRQTVSKPLIIYFNKSLEWEAFRNESKESGVIGFVFIYRSQSFHLFPLNGTCPLQKWALSKISAMQWQATVAIVQGLQI